MFSSNPRPLPQRTHSINAVKHATYFGSIDEELRDCKRVQRHGQEEDLREALTRMMARVEEMRDTLKSSYHKTTDLETQLTLAESNLKLALANNEMLEDALKSSSLSKDVGWRRSSRDTGPLQPVSSPPVTASLPTSQSQQTSISESEAEGGAPAPDSSGSDRDSRPPSPAPPPLTDLRFFRFRFTGSGRSTPTQPRSSSSRVSRSQSTSHPAAGHLTSASLPSLVTPPTIVNSELEELREQLLIERGKSEKVMREKSELESELESLSQALFEEANRMVKVERIKRAEAEDELQEVHAEKDALKSALRLIEEHRLRAESSHQQHVNGIEPSEQTIAPTHSRSSSQEAIVSPRQRPRGSPTPPSPPSPTAEPTDVAISINVRDSEDPPSSPAPPSPAPLYVPPPHLVDSAPASRTASPKPLPHPHRLSHLRTTAPPPAPPPPSAADGYPISPWACPPSGEEEDTDVAAETGFTVPKIVTLYSPPDEGEMAAPWGKW